MAGRIDKSTGRIDPAEIDNPRVDDVLDDLGALVEKMGGQVHVLETRLEGRQPVSVTEHAATLEQAVHGARKKLAHLVDGTLGRLHDDREKTSGLPLSGTEAAQR